MPTTSVSRGSRAALLLGAVIAIPLLALIAGTGFDGLYGQDSYGYVNYARGPLADALRQAGQPPPFFFPPGYPLLIAVATIAGAGADGAALAISVVSGAAVPSLVGLLTYAVAPVADARERLWAALLAALTVGLAGQLWQSSVVAMSDMLALACATAGMLAAVRYARAPASPWIVAAAGLMSFSIETRLIYAAAGASGVLVLVYGLRQRGARRAAVDAAFAILVGALVLAPMALPMVDALVRHTAMPFVGQAVVHSWDPLNAVRSTFETADGRLTYALPSGAFYLLQPAAPYWFTVLAVLVIPGIWSVLRALTPVAAAVLLVWPLLTIGFMAGDTYQNTRFFLAAAPSVAALIAIGAWAVWSALRRRWPRAATPALVGALVVVLAVNGLLAWRFSRNFIERVTTDTERLSALTHDLPSRARVISLGATSQLIHAGLDAVELTSIDPSAPVMTSFNDRPTYLLVDLAAIRGQWAGRQPELALEALAATAGLTALERAGPWILYAVGHI